FVVNGGDQALPTGVEQRHAGGFVDAAALRLDHAVLDLVARAEAVTSADAVGLEQHVDGALELLPVDGGRTPADERQADAFRVDASVCPPVGNAHDRVH